MKYSKNKQEDSKTFSPPQYFRTVAEDFFNVFIPVVRH